LVEKKSALTFALRLKNGFSSSKIADENGVKKLRKKSERFG
jgi:hypothetical protein